MKRVHIDKFDAAEYRRQSWNRLMMKNENSDDPKTLYIPDKHVWRRGVVFCYAGTLSRRLDTSDKPGVRDGASL